MTWMDNAKCAGMDPDFFFEPEPEDFATHAEYVHETKLKSGIARRFCRGCPVSIQCLAANQDAPYGVFGGVGARTRERMRTPGTKQVPRPAATEEMKSLIRKMRFEQHLTYDEISTRTGVNKGTISRVIHADRSPDTPVMVSWNSPKYEQVRELLLGGQYSIREIVRKTNISRSTISRIRGSMVKEGMLV